ncbi:MAG: hypothetical protein B7733_09080 [Myxococcales bacterium FL481]|nr:MAG: hypothetical protein B7733_09080 [Myxococcales bacterium FL481]
MPSGALTTEQLLAWRVEPIEIGSIANTRTIERFGDVVSIRHSPALPAEPTTCIIRRGELTTHPGWPQPHALKNDDELVVNVRPSQARRWLDYLTALSDGGPERWTLAPVSDEPGATFKLWLVATARVRLGDAHDSPPIHVAARHDALGLRLAQVALSFGADVMAGPIADERRLPLAGMTRPTENTKTGLALLIQQAARRPQLTPSDRPGETV